MILPNSATDYVDVVGVSQSVIVDVLDNTYTSAGDGVNIIERLTLRNAIGAETVFENFPFKDIKFLGDGTSQYTFVNCSFENCSKINCDIITDDDCIGTILDLDNTQTLLLNDVKDNGGAYTVLHKNGDIQGKRILGRKAATVSAAATITMANGNYMQVTGSGITIDTITTTGWVDGSHVYIYFAGVNTLTATGGNLSIAAGTLVTVAGGCYEFIYDTGVWVHVL